MARFMARALGLVTVTALAIGLATISFWQEKLLTVQAAQAQPAYAAEKSVFVSSDTLRTLAAAAEIHVAAPSTAIEVAFNPAHEVQQVAQVDVQQKVAIPEAVLEQRSTREPEEESASESAAPAAQSAQASAPASTIAYKVQAGDSLNAIARYFDISVQALVAANGLDVRQLLARGQTLYIPIPSAPAAAQASAAVAEATPEPTDAWMEETPEATEAATEEAAAETSEAAEAEETPVPTEEAMEESMEEPEAEATEAATEESSEEAAEEETAEAAAEESAEETATPEEELMEEPEAEATEAATEEAAAEASEEAGEEEAAEATATPTEETSEDAEATEEATAEAAEEEATEEASPEASEEETAEATATPTEEVSEEPEAEATAEATEEAGEEETADILDTLAELGNFSTLISMLDTAGLSETLKTEGPLTLFAPNDDAFAALPEGTVDGLLASSPDDLSQILLYHLLQGAVLSTDLNDGATLITAQGAPLEVTVTADGIKVNDANLIITDIETSNGVIHVIDAVLLPSDETASVPIGTDASLSPEAASVDAASVIIVPVPVDEATASAHLWEEPSGKFALFSPVQTGGYHSPIEVIGLSRTFEGNVAITLVGADGSLLAQRMTLGGSEDYAFFQTDLRFDVQDSTEATLNLLEIDMADGSILSTVDTPLTLLPGQRVLDVTIPVVGDTVCDPIVVSGYSNTFEANVVLTLQDPNGQVLAEIPTIGGSMGTYRDFATPLPYNVSEATPLLVSVSETDAEGNLPSIDQTVIPVTLFPPFSAACH